MQKVCYRWFVLLSLLGCSLGARAQSVNEAKFELTTNKDRAERIQVDLVHNLMLIPVQINGAETILNFILDTGVGNPLITSLPNGAVLPLKYVDVVEIGGLGGERRLKAYSSYNNKIQVERLDGSNQDVLLLLEDIFHLTTYLGTETSGLIGYNIFKDFIVELDYEKKWVKFHDHDRYEERYQQKKKERHWGVLPLTFKNNKPYVQVVAEQEDGSQLTLNLLIDSGASHALSLYQTANEQIYVPENSIYSKLGTGLSGGVEGHLGKINRLFLDKFQLPNVVTQYPSEEDIHHAIVMSSRDGAIGADILKRFKVMFNYRDSTVIFTPSKYFDEPFKYNRAGLEVISVFPGVPIYEIAYIRPESPGEKAGFIVGDTIVRLNGDPVSRYSLNDVLEIFEAKREDRVIIQVARDDSTITRELRLVDELSPDTRYP